MGEVTVSAKDKKKDKTDRDKRSQNRTHSDKEREELEKATRKSLKAERKAAKKKAEEAEKEARELAEVLEKSRLEAVRAARVLQTLPSKSIASTPLLALGKQNLFVSDVFGNLNVSSAATPSSFFDPFATEEIKKEPPRVRNGIDMITCPMTGQIICRPRRNKEDPSSDAPPCSFPSAHPSGSKDSKVDDGPELEGTKGTLVSESKDTVADPVGLVSDHLPLSENKSDSETELPFKFPPIEGNLTEGATMNSPLYSPARLRSSSSEEATLDVKLEPTSGQRNSNYDPNDENDIRNGLLRDDHPDDHILSSLSSSDNKTASIERSVVTCKDVDMIRSLGSTWQSESDVLMAMRHLTSKDSRPNLVIDKKALASVIFHSRPPPDFLNDIVRAQAESFKLGKIDFENRMSQLRASETKKICAPRQEVERLKSEYEDKLRDLNLRIQASIALEENTKVSTRRLDDVLNDNKNLKDQNQRLQAILKNVRDGEKLVPEKPIPTPPPAKPPIRVTQMVPNLLGAPIRSSSDSSASMSSPFPNPRDVKKRDLSPDSKTNISSTSKKSCANTNNVWQRWQRDGTAVAMAYIHGPALKVLQGKSSVELDVLLAKVTLAASNFRDLFPNDNDPEDGIRYRNEEPHSEFRGLQVELLIPTIENGRKFALSFYYGKILASIHSVVQMRETFLQTEEDGPKITAYIGFRGQNSYEVSNWRNADNQNVQMKKNTREYCQAYKAAFEAARLPNAAKPPWVCETTFNVLRNLKIPYLTRYDTEMYDKTYKLAREEFSRYFYNTNTHTIIDFVRAARNHASKSRFSKPAGNNSSYGGGPRSSA